MPITVIGSLNLDLVTTVPRLPLPGETVMGTGLVRRPGGKGANQAIAGSRAGGVVRMVGTCGSDDASALLTGALDDEAVDITHLHASADHSTGTAMIMVDACGENVIALTPGANSAMTTERVDEACATLSDEDLVLLQLELPLPVVEHAARAAKERSATVVLNAAPAVAGVADLLDHVDVLVVNEHELVQVSSELGSVDDGPESRSRYLANRTGCLVVTTLGHEGALMTDRAGSVRFPSPTVRVVDSTGAGDTFTGYLAAGLSRGMRPQEAIGTAIEAASLMVSRHGTQEAIPSLRELSTTPKKPSDPPQGR